MQVTTDPAHPGMLLINALAQTITQQQAPHGLALDALLSLYSALLAQPPCCFEGGEQGLAIAAARLAAAKRAHLNARQAAQSAIAHAAGMH